jgi:hypothetical protein
MPAFAVTGSPEGHGLLRVVLGLALTGFAFVIAGRQTRRRGVAFPLFSAPLMDVHPRDAAPAPTAPDAIRVAPMVTTDLNDIPPARGTEGPGVPTAPPDNDTDSFDAVMTRITTMLDTAAGRGQRSEPGEGAPGAAAVDTRRDTAAPEPEHAMAGPLRRVGLDAALVDTLCARLRDGGVLEDVLHESFAGLVCAHALPSAVGSLLVVVGDGGPARRLAASLADEIGIDPTAVPYASLDAGAYTVATGTLLVRTAQEAAARAPGWRRTRASVVAVDAPMNGTGRAWATDVVGALRPTAIWGVVNATAKTEDVAHWAGCFGAMDALAVENLGATVSPASALGVGIPVARLDGHPASPARWVATIVDRVGSTISAPASSSSSSG